MRAPDPAVTLPRCAPGSRVSVIAPSSPIRPEMLEEGLEQVRGLGLEPRVRDDIAARHLFFAGSEERRLQELSDALAAPEGEPVFVARGGYGLLPLLSRLTPGSLAASPRVLLGQSDATALGCWALTQGIGWLHGPMVAGHLRLGPAGFDAASLRAALFDVAGEVAPPGVTALREGHAEGILWGGCLSLLAALCGTPWMPRPGPSVLALEDVGVKPYQVHRMLVQLRDAGALHDVRGVLLGDFSDCVQHVEQGYEIGEVLAEFLDDALGAIPVGIGWPIGHAKAPHVTLPMGARVRYRVDAGASSLAWTR